MQDDIEMQDTIEMQFSNILVMSKIFTRDYLTDFTVLISSRTYFDGTDIFSSLSIKPSIAQVSCNYISSEGCWMNVQLFNRERRFRG